MALITAQEVVNKAFINANTDTAIIKGTYIEVSELTHLKPFLGDDLYEEIVEQNNTSTLTTLNEALLNDYLKDYLAFCIKFEVFPTMTYNISSQGINESLDVFSTPLNESKLNFLRQDVYRKSIIFKNKAEEFLNNNREDYPLWGGGSSSGVKKRFGIITY